MLCDLSVLSHVLFVDAPSNDRLRIAFQRVHSELIDSIDPASTIDYLFSTKVLSKDHLRRLQRPNIDAVDRCRDMMATLHASHHPEAFVKLRRALAKEAANDWLIRKIDEVNNSFSVNSGR
jgi:hypothetical protein